MIISQYKLVSAKIKGEIIFIYHGGNLFSLVIDVRDPLSAKQFAWLFKHIKYEERWLRASQYCMDGIQLKTIIGGGNTEKGELKLIPDAPIDETAAIMPVHERIALFCRLYEQYITVKYKVSAKDSGMIKSVEVTSALLTTYFTSDNVLFRNKHSIGNYTKFYNQLRAECAGAYAKPRFPNYHDTAFEKKLEGQELTDYYKHLRGLGWVSTRREGTNIITWTQKDEKQAPEQNSQRETTQEA